MNKLKIYAVTYLVFLLSYQFAQAAEKQTRTFPYSTGKYNLSLISDKDQMPGAPYRNNLKADSHKVRRNFNLNLPLKNFDHPFNTTRVTEDQLQPRKIKIQFKPENYMLILEGKNWKKD